MTTIDEVRAELAPTGTLRAGINLSNFLLVTGRDDTGDPTGVSPDMAAEVARRLGVDLQLVAYDKPHMLADAVDNDEWDIGNIGAEPQRAEKIAFTAAYCEIESTYMVPPASAITSMDEVDQAGNRIAVAARTAYGLWIERNIKQAELIWTDSLTSSFETFRDQGLEVLAGLKPRLLEDAEKMPGARILDGKFSAVQQAIGTPRRNTAAAPWLAAFVEEAKRSGLVQNLIGKHRVTGLSVAPAA